MYIFHMCLFRVLMPLMTLYNVNSMKGKASNMWLNFWQALVLKRVQLFIALLGYFCAVEVTRSLTNCALTKESLNRDDQLLRCCCCCCSPARHKTGLIGHTLGEKNWTGLDQICFWLSEEFQVKYIYTKTEWQVFKTFMLQRGKCSD